MQNLSDMNDTAQALRILNTKHTKETIGGIAQC